MKNSDLVTEFNKLSKILRNWPDAEFDDKFETPHITTLINSLLDLKKENSTTKKGDLAVLIRQVLRAGKTPGDLDATLYLPKLDDDPVWPNQKEWSEFGINAELLRNEIRLTANPWNPDWLEGGKHIVDEKVSGVPHYHLAKKQNSPPFIHSDPFLNELFEGKGAPSNYYSQVQKDAIRNVLASKSGSTVIVNLPTGGGKSLVALAPIYLHQPIVSVCIVPTIALAIDQEARLREITADVEKNFAYTSYTSESNRAEIRQNIRTGQQAIVFVSPEMATRALVHSLFIAAKNGFLGYFIVDEAHLLDSWGTEFRPAFQTMVGLRNELLEVQKEENKTLLRTILMSATFTNSSLELLMNLFGEPGPVIPCISNRLRSEPSYWSSESSSLAIREEQVIEALRHLPRPAIVFCTVPSKAESLKETIEKCDFSRVGLFTGNTSAADRDKVLDQIRNRQIDIVVATSTFGLGVDISDIRTVIHACLPDSIDRYYQEVGRAGRDGHPSISIVCWTTDPNEREEDIAKNNAIPRQLTWDTLHRRWNTLKEEAVKVNKSWAANKLIYQLNMTALPDYLEFESNKNIYWNVNTVTLLVRSGILKLRWMRPEIDEIDEIDTPQDEKEVILCLQLIGEVTRTTWDSKISPTREKTQKANEKSHKMMLALLKEKKAACDYFLEAYDLKGIGYSPALPNPVHACGGCPEHRETVNSPASNALRLQSINPTSTFVDKTRILENLRMDMDSECQIILYDDSEENLNTKFANCIRHFVKNGINVLNASTDLLKTKEIKEFLKVMHHTAETRVTLVNELNGPFSISHMMNPPLPQLSILTEERQIEGIGERIFSGKYNVIRIFIMPNSYREKTWHPAETLSTKFPTIVKQLEEIIR